ncbi:MAG: UvrD-helicase domain-containing protein [Verrucomicrobiales bacterium]
MIPPAPLTHEAILASAGSGKTHTLVTRYLRLLASGQPPERIIALTFTRKAAGEFFDKIVHRLADAAASEDARVQLAQSLDRSRLDQSEAVQWLRAVVERLPFLTLGTLDSFFIRMVSAFPLEFGLGGPFVLLEGADIEVEREEVCRRVFQALPADRRHEQVEFLAAFDQATFGLEEKSLHRAFDTFIQDHHLAWILDPVAEKWGHPARVWPRLPWYFEFAKEDPVALRRELEAAMDGLTLQKRQREKLLEIAGSLAEHEPGKPDARKFKYIRESLFPALDDLPRGAATVKIYQPLEVPEALGRPLAALIGRMLAGEAAVVLERTRGLAAVLADYERHHEAMVRREGRLTFDDVKWLLARGGPEGGEGRGRSRLAVDERLDARFDHWLIDEFQDTSLLQWDVLRPLVEEALQDPEGRRTYFQVGDEKQSIYRWRGGEPELGRHIIDLYGLSTRPLTASWRSAPPVIEVVNAVFGNETAVASVVPPAALTRWVRGWVDHTTHRTERRGFAALLHPASDGETAEIKPVLERELEVVAALLREIRPLDRGLTVAVLLRSNDDVAGVVEFLRSQPELPPVVSESDASVAVDNPVTLALLSVLRVAAHPGDTMAWEHVRMTPLPDMWTEGDWSRGHLVGHTLQFVLTHGFEAWVRWWAGRLDGRLARDDAFSRLRLDQLGELARVFDTRGSREIDAFLRVVESATARESARPGAIQVMTIHKSKGLDFDIVFLPRLAGKSFHDDSRQPLLRRRDDDFSTRWVLRRPPAELAVADVAIKAAHDESQAAQAYEGLCVLYVAMTRARHALYLIGDKGAGLGTARHGAALIDRALVSEGVAESVVADGRDWECGWRSGDPRWFEEVPRTDEESKVPIPESGRSAFVPPTAGARRRPRQTPSGRESHVLTSAQVFSSAASPARELGVLVHAMFERVADPADQALLRSWWTASFPEPTDWQRDAWRQVLACLDSERVAAALRVPPGAVLWREKRFEIILNGEWVTGTFDRVIVGATDALIVDFKTDDVADASAAFERADGYRPQLSLYRDVLSRLTGLEPRAIRAALIFTRIRDVVAVE